MATPAERWIDAWFRAWTEHDPAALDGVYAPGPVQRSAPFREPIVPQEYAAWAFADEVAVEVWFAEPNGSACAWWAIVTDVAGTTATLAGVSVLRLDDSGLVADQRDYWHLEDGAHRPPGDWGPVRRHGSLDARR
jgi:SnoaL-like protein